jgi:hypothetical protein
MARGRKSNFTAAQLVFLEDLYPDFEEAQRSGKLPRFWPRMHNKYFKEWSVEDELGIARDELDDGSGEGPKGMSVDDATKVGEATKKMKAVSQTYLLFSKKVTVESHSNC